MTTKKECGTKCYCIRNEYKSASEKIKMSKSCNMELRARYGDWSKAFLMVIYTHTGAVTHTHIQMHAHRHIHTLIPTIKKKDRGSWIINDRRLYGENKS